MATKFIVVIHLQTAKEESVIYFAWPVTAVRPWLAENCLPSNFNVTI